MGLLSWFKFVFKSLLLFTIAINVILFSSYFGPHNASFTAYELTPTRKLEGPLAVNEKLNNAERLFENLVKGPESLVHDNGVLYTGVHGGLVLKIIGQQLIPFVKFGKSCDGQYEEHICGRPLGLHIVPKTQTLYVADAYYGLFGVNTTTGESKQLVNSNDWIEGRKPKLFNSVTVGSDGIIYWTDSDSNFDLKNLVFSTLTDGTGRLIRYDPTTGRNTVLLDKLSFANGILLSKHELFILVAESFKYRVLRYYLKGPKKGTSDVFVDGLPGAPDNFKRHPKTGNIFLGLVFPRDDEHTPTLVRDIGKYPLLRKLAARLLYLVQRIFISLDQVFPHKLIKKAIHATGHCETLNSVMPHNPRVTIVELNQNGNIIGSLHALDGRIFGICEVEFVDDQIYLASPFNHYLARVTLK